MKKMAVKTTCCKCGQTITYGRTKYRMHVEVDSDFDGFLPSYQDEEGELEQTLEEAKKQSAGSLEDDVHQEFSLTLCWKCMHAVVDDLKEMADPRTLQRRGYKVTVQ